MFGAVFTKLKDSALIEKLIPRVQDLATFLKLLGRSAIPVVDLSQTTREFRRSPVLTPISTLLQFRPVEREEYDEVRRLVDADQYVVRRAPVEFSLSAFDGDPVGYARSIKDLLS